MPVSISAHRGGPAAPDTGAEYVELDIRRTRDHQLVVFHDERPHPDAPPVSALSYRQLCADAGHPVPLVGATLAAVAGRVMGHLDLKESGYEDTVVALATDLLGSGRFVVTSRADRSVARIKREFPTERAALTLGKAEVFSLRRIRACGADAVAVHHRLARWSVLRLCARHRLGAMVWTVNDDRLMRAFLADPRVDVLITDRPARAVKLREGVQLR